MASLLDALINARHYQVAGVQQVRRETIDFVNATSTDDGLVLHITIPPVLAYTALTAAYTQPAVGAPVSVAVESTEWMVPGSYVSVEGGGYYALTSVTDATHAVLTLVDGTAAESATVATAGAVSPSGPQGTGTAATSFAIDTANAGPRVANESGTLAVRNAADSAYAGIVAASASLTASAIVLRAGATTNGDVLVQAAQASSTVKYGWVSAEAKFGVSSDNGATWTYLTAAAPPGCGYDEFEGSQDVTETTAAITGLSLTPTAGNYLLTACPVITPPAETHTVSVAVYIAGTIVSVTNRAHPPTGSAAAWEPTVQVKSTLTGSQAVTVQVTCDGTATVTKCTLTALAVT